MIKCLNCKNCKQPNDYNHCYKSKASITLVPKYKSWKICFYKFNNWTQKWTKTGKRISWVPEITNRLKQYIKNNTIASCKIGIYISQPNHIFKLKRYELIDVENAKQKAIKWCNKHNYIPSTDQKITPLQSLQLIQYWKENGYYDSSKLSKFGPNFYKFKTLQK
jgi:hypothetical protein